MNNMLLGNKLLSDKTLALLIIGLISFLAVSLFSNLVLGGLAFKLYAEQKTVIVPMGIRQPVVASMVSADEYFIKMTALSFLSLRLTVTPETVDGNHSELLSYVNPEVRPKLEKMLGKDADLIHTNNITSAFYMSSYTISPDDGAFIVTGTLHTKSGDIELTPQSKTYKILMRYANGETQIDDFSEIKINE